MLYFPIKVDYFSRLVFSVVGQGLSNTGSAAPGCHGIQAEFTDCFTTQPAQQPGCQPAPNCISSRKIVYGEYAVVIIAFQVLLLVFSTTYAHFYIFRQWLNKVHYNCLSLGIA